MSELVDGVKQIMANTSSDPIRSELDASENLQAAKKLAITGLGTTALTLVLFKTGIEPAAGIVGGTGLAKCVYHYREFVSSGRNVRRNLYRGVWGDFAAQAAADDEEL
jgi:hypothetical protein